MNLYHSSKLMSSELVSVQPLSAPSVTLFYMDYIYHDDYCCPECGSRDYDINKHIYNCNKCSHIFDKPITEKEFKIKNRIRKIEKILK